MDDELRETFFLECADLMEVLESGLLSLSRGEGDGETVNAVFRAIHSIKGGAGAFNLTEMVRFAHRFETALDEVRDKRVEPTTDVLNVFLRCSDALGDLVSANAEGAEGDAAAVNACVAELTKLIGDEDGEDEEGGAAGGDVAFEAQTIDIGLDFGNIALSPAGEDPSETYAIVFKPYAALYDRGHEATLLLRAIADLGEAEIVCDVPEALEFTDPSFNEPSITWRINVTTTEKIDAVWEVFEFVEGDCDLSIKTAAQSREDGAPEAPEPTVDLAADPLPVVPIDLGEGAAAPAADAPAPADEANAEAPEPTSTPKKDEAAPKPAAKEAKSAPPKKTIRVDLERVDGLINLVGELAINQAMLTEQFTEMAAESNSGASDRFEELKSLTREIQERVMAVRAQPVKSLFQRMTRIVREAAAATGKTVRLTPEGEDTEVDATIVERLADPLTHMIRNAVDHGLETPEKRAAANKPAEGEVRLTARHRSGRIVIKVSDDGAGIDREKVLNSAIKKGLIAEDAQLTDSEIDNLLFLPGFSTAAQVSDLSGRGVGMDVVKRSIQALGGRTSISSEPGVGTTISISLPLTLAVLDGVVVRIANQTLVIPLSNVVETLRMREASLREFADDAGVLLLRGEPVPIVDVGRILDLRREPLDLTDFVFIVVETSEGGQSAIPIDEIYYQRQVVIKGLEASYGAVPGVAAATILGNGDVALILDLEAIVEEASQSQSQTHSNFAMAE